MLVIIIRMHAHTLCTIVTAVFIVVKKFSLVVLASYLYKFISDVILIFVCVQVYLN